MIQYHHTQPGTQMRFILGGCALAAALIALALARVTPQHAIIPLFSLTILVIALALFHSLTVTVTGDAIALSYGIGLIRKRFAVADVAGATAVRNRWYHGLGIKLTAHGWAYTVSGLDAVELELEDDRKVRIGTDEPAKLVSAIESVTAS